ncbi:MAG: 3-deoxy-manno-octulosonate cytidylyltransferase [Planctomycetota bacterium]|jgi:3-deoxy-manno-octulosonate cytidylyltransferase (CMP-KDO synthetase)
MKNTGNAVIIIPARLASTRMPEKLMRSDTGKPLITHTVEKAEAARDASDGRISQVIVAADSEVIIECVNSYCKEKGYSALAQMTSVSHQSGTDRIAEVAEKLSSQAEVIINLQGDEPDMPVSAILQTLDLLESNSEAHMSTLYREIRSKEDFINPNFVKVVVDKEGKCLYFSRSPIPYDREQVLGEGEVFGYLHFGIYGYRREILLGYSSLPESKLEKLEKLEQLRALEAGLIIAAAKTDFSGAGIDTEDDYREFLARTSNNQS